MKTGKVSENILIRSVLKQIKTKREEVLIGADIGVDCAILTLQEEEAFAVCMDPVTCTSLDAARIALHNVCNDLAASGAEPVAVMMSALFPPESSEEEIRAYATQLEETCSKINVQLCGGHTEVTKAVNMPILTAAGVGRINKNCASINKKTGPGQDIVLSKWIGLEGTCILAKERAQELLTRYPAYLVEEAKTFDRYHSILPEAAAAVKSGVSIMHDVSEGGIFGALWEIAERADVGLCVDLKKIPLRQETVEVCEFFGISPYGLLSGGCLIMITEDGYGLVNELQKQQIPAVIIGRTTDNRNRIIQNEEECRFLEPAKSDEIYKIMDP